MLKTNCVFISPTNTEFCIPEAFFTFLDKGGEITEILKICSDVRKELQRDEIPIADNIETGIMIETPASAIISDKLAPLVDFFSVGKNDLTQYTLACDRQNPQLERFCDTHHEAVLRLIETAAKNAHANGKWIGICGELAADLTLTETFLRMGIDELSVSPSFVLKLRETIRAVDLRPHENTSYLPQHELPTGQAFI